MNSYDKLGVFLLLVIALVNAFQPWPLDVTFVGIAAFIVGLVLGNKLRAVGYPQDNKSG